MRALVMVHLKVLDYTDIRPFLHHGLSSHEGLFFSSPLLALRACKISDDMI